VALPHHLTRVAVLASGGGSNLQALLDYLDVRGGSRRADVALVVSNKPDAGALQRARARGIATATVSGKAADLEPMEELLAENAIDLVVLAGYLRMVPPALTRRWRGRILNVHPALLPAFGGPGMYGERVHQAVLDRGVRVTGATVHFVDEVYDHGAIIAQWPVPVFDEDTAPTLAARVLRAEHALYPRVIDAVAAEEIALDDDGTVRGAFLMGQAGETFALAPADVLVSQIESALSR
jgi:formyltetrahydrofolate-dependent phosphoribosylglycinamide formyltransferase